MSQIRRARIHGPIAVDVRLIQEIEGAVMLDCEPPPSVIAPLWARAEALEWNAPTDSACADDVDSALDPWGGILTLDEIHAVQRLWGWHRARHGRVTVDAYWLAETRNVLDNLTLSYGEECDQAIEDFGLDGVTTGEPAEVDREIRAEVLAYLREYGTCGECNWCHVLRLRDQCDAILDAAGYYGGSYYDAYCRPVTVTVGAAV